MSELDTLGRLARVRHLLAGLPGPYGNEHLWTLVEAPDGGDVFRRVFAFLQECGVIDSVSRFADAPQAPQDDAELCPLLWEVDQDAALAVLAGMASTTLAYRVTARYSVDKAHEVFGRLAKLLGRQTCWWSNTDLTSWNPVTRHSMDALVVGVGGDVVVAVLAED